LEKTQTAKTSVTKIYIYEKKKSGIHIKTKNELIAAENRQNEIVRYIHVQTIKKCADQSQNMHCAQIFIQNQQKQKKQ